MILVFTTIQIKLLKIYVNDLSVIWLMYVWYELSLVRVVCLEEHHLLWTDLDLAFVAQPHVLVTVGESLTVYFYKVFLAEAADLPALGLEVVKDQGVLSRNWAIGQLQVHLVTLAFFCYVRSLFVPADEENCVRDVLLPSRAPQGCIAELRKVTHMNGLR